MEQKSERLKRRKRRRMLPWITAAALTALLGLFIALLFVILSPKNKKDPTDSADTGTSTERASEVVSTESTTAEILVPDTPEADSTDETDISSSEEETEPDTGGEDSTETQTEPTKQTEPSTAPSPGSPDYGKVAFIGDSRILYLGSGEDPRFAGLVPNDAINGTSGAQVAFGVAHQDAMDAAIKNRAIAVFWYGINDVQVSYQRDDVDFFIGEFSSVIDTYKSANTSNSKICILSVLSTGEAEKDYYPEQNANIDRYNEGLKALCKDKGYTYLDVTGLFRGDACLRDDHIHFTKEWYENELLPYLKNELGL